MRLPSSTLRARSQPRSMPNSSARAERIAAAGRVNHFGRCDAGNVLAHAVAATARTLRCERDDHAPPGANATATPASRRSARTACALRSRSPRPSSPARRSARSSAPSNMGSPWPGSKMNGIFGVGELRARAASSRRGHRARRCRRGCRCGRHGGQVRRLHRARMERGDLAVVRVGDDDRLRR